MRVLTLARLKPGETQISINQNQLQILDKSYTFDGIITDASDLQNKYLHESIQQFKNGFNQVIFCYGQTGSGKTYTVNQLIPIILNNLFDTRLEISCSVLQIYNEKILDMLCKQQLKLRYKKNEFVAENLTKFICHSPDEIMGLLNRANKRRIVNSHALNDFSSRSHCIYTFYGTSSDIQCEFNIVDLAGSERLNQTKVQQVQESVEINKSLFYLRLVIQHLADKIPQIPYRQSKLTSLLRRSLNGKSNVTMIICLNPSDENLQQSQQSAQYGVKARTIILQPEQQLDDKLQQIKELKLQVYNLESELKIAQNLIKTLKNKEVPIQSTKSSMESVNSINNLLGQNKKLRDEVHFLHEQINSLQSQNSQLNNENQDLRDKINIFEDIISEDLKKNKDPKNWMDLFQEEGSSYMDIILKKLQMRPKTKNENTRNQRSFSIGRKEFKF